MSPLVYWLRIVISAIVALVFASLAIGNARVMFRYVTSERRGSLVPVVGALAGVIAILVAPCPVNRAWLWLPLVLDIGGLPMIVMLIIKYVRPSRS